MYLNKQRLDGQMAIVTGGASGIGAACADAFLEAGAHVVVADHSEANLAEARSRLRAVDVSFELLDVTNTTSVNGLAERLKFVDILVNNAGIGRQTAAEGISDAGTSI